MLSLSFEKPSLDHIPSSTLGHIFDFLGVESSCSLRRTSKFFHEEHFKFHEHLFSTYYSCKELNAHLISVPNFEMRFAQHALCVAQRHLLGSPSAILSTSIKEIAKLEAARNLILFYQALIPYLEPFFAEIGDAAVFPVENADQLIYADNIRFWLEAHQPILSLITEDFNISNRGLSAIPEEISYLKNIKALDASENALVNIPIALCDCYQLRYLILSDNLIESLPSAIGRLLNLKQIDVSRNHLRYLPSSIGFLPNLTRLDLSSNKLTNLPSTFTASRSLTSCDLSLNYLRSLPSDLHNLVSLSALDVKGNSLSVLHPSLGHVFNLIDLDLSDNQIVEIPSSFENLYCLRKLNLSGNRLVTLPRELSSLDNVKYLNLSRNQLAFLPPKVWEMAARASQLKIFGNPFAFGIPDTIKKLLEDKPGCSLELASASKTLFKP